MLVSHTPSFLADWLAIRAAQASTGARKAKHEEEMRRIAAESADEKIAIAKEVSAEKDVSIAVGATPSTMCGEKGCDRVTRTLLLRGGSHAL